MIKENFMLNIHVDLIKDQPVVLCKVIVEENGNSTTHMVTVPEDIYQKLTGGVITHEECVRTAFKFLLDREPKESILSQFDLPVISQYFPEFSNEFQNYM